jgi:hypothetical protein
MKTEQQIITEYAQRFGISESRIDESIIPILYILDENTNANKAIVKKIKGSILTEQHIYYNAMSAWFGMSAKFFFPSIMVMFIAFLIYSDIQDQREKSETFRDAGFFVFRSKQLKKDNIKLYEKYFK